jgi:hypothetical protein
MTWITPTKEVAPYITGADPRSTSMRSTSVRSRVESAGLNAPPQGTPSTTSRKASNSRRPQISGTELAAPASPPGATTTPATVDRAVARSVAPRARISSPVMTVTEAGTGSTSSGTRVAVTCSVSETLGTSPAAAAAWSGPEAASWSWWVAGSSSAMATVRAGSDRQAKVSAAANAGRAGCKRRPVIG